MLISWHGLIIFVSYRGVPRGVSTGFQEIPTKIVGSKQSPGHSAAVELICLQTKNSTSITTSCTLL